MERRGSSRRRIIDSTSVPSSRRKERPQSSDTADSRTNSDVAASNSDGVNDKGIVSTEVSVNVPGIANEAQMLCEVTDDEISVVSQFIRPSVKQEESRYYDECVRTVIDDNDGVDTHRADVDICIGTSSHQTVSPDQNGHREQETEVVSSLLFNMEPNVIKQCKMESNATQCSELNRRYSSLSALHAIDKMLEGECDYTQDVPSIRNTKRTTAQVAIKPWMVHMGDIRKESLFPAIPEEIHRELRDRDFMLPWGSVRLDETYRVTKPNLRRSVSHRTDLLPSKHESAGISPRDKQETIANIYKAVYEETTERRDSLSMELIDEPLWQAAIPNHDCSFQRTNVKRGLETKDPYSIELERTTTSADVRTGNEALDLLDNLLGLGPDWKHTGAEDPLLDMISVNFDIEQDDQGILGRTTDTQVMDSSVLELFYFIRIFK